MAPARAKVLVVDDEESIRSVLRQALTDAGHHVLAAENGQQALDVLSRSDIEVMLLDIRMPGLSGLDVLSEVQALSPDTCVIMVTAIAEVATAVDAMKQGAYDYVAKPFDLDEVVTAIADVSAAVDAMKQDEGSATGIGARDSHSARPAAQAGDDAEGEMIDGAG